MHEVAVSQASTGQTAGAKPWFAEHSRHRSCRLRRGEADVDTGNDMASLCGSG